MPETLSTILMCIFVVPAGALNSNKTLWLSKAGKYLFVEKNLAKVFRAKFIELMIKAGYYLPAKHLKMDFRLQTCG